MRERFVDIETPSGRMETSVTHPEQHGPFPAYLSSDAADPLSMVKEFEGLLRPCPVAYRHRIHEGALHGHALPNRDTRLVFFFVRLPPGCL